MDFLMHLLRFDHFTWDNAGNHESRLHCESVYNNAGAVDNRQEFGNAETNWASDTEGVWMGRMKKLWALSVCVQ